MPLIDILKREGAGRVALRTAEKQQGGRRKAGGKARQHDVQNNGADVKSGIFDSKPLAKCTNSLLERIVFPKLDRPLHDPLG